MATVTLSPRTGPAQQFTSVDRLTVLAMVRVVLDGGEFVTRGNGRETTWRAEDIVLIEVAR